MVAGESAMLELFRLFVMPISATNIYVLADT